MKLKRKITGWAECSPKAMSQMSEAAIQFALEDARADILTMGALLCEAGYPRRGTAEENMSMQDFANKVQAIIPHDEAVNLP